MDKSLIGIAIAILLLSLKYSTSTVPSILHLRVTFRMLVRQLTSRNYLGKWSFRLAREESPADNERANNGRANSIFPTKRRRNFTIIEPLERVVFRLNVQGDVGEARCAIGTKVSSGTEGPVVRFLRGNIHDERGKSMLLYGPNDKINDRCLTLN